MAFLAPFFLIGLAAIALPVLLHLRKNRPKQTVEFSSLMFLEESPPITRTRARLQDLLLLFLRCLAIALLILAFARPFFPVTEQAATVDGAAMNFILIDASASMRGEPSERALKIAETLIDGFSEKDWIAVAGFSNKLKPLLDPERARSLAPGERKSSARAALAAMKADWQSTRLDTALLAALAAAGQDSTLRIHLIGDLQKGSTLERLRGEVWPGAVQIIPHPVPPAAGWTNAGIHVLPLEKQVQRVRLINSQGSAKSDFKLTWQGVAESLQVSVPAGESAVFDAPSSLPPVGKITLTGDDFCYDNEAFWTTPARPVAKVWYPEQTLAADPKESAYFLNRALQSTPDYAVEIVATRPGDPPALTILSGPAEVDSLLKAGGNVLFTVRDAASAKAIGEIIGGPSGEAREAVVNGHALFGEIDFKSAVFAQFADARYADFSRIRIWKYRVLPTEITTRGQVLARFDTGDPAWLGFTIGSGTLHVLTTTWRPDDSQLALTTKFPPLLHSLLSHSALRHGQRGPLTIGDAAEISTDAPGIYQNGSTSIAVQLAPAESELTPMLESELRTLGIPLDPPQDLARAAASAKQFSNAEQESRQRLGWWLLVCAASFILLETLWAGFASKSLTPVSP